VTVPRALALLAGSFLAVLLVLSWRWLLAAAILHGVYRLYRRSHGHVREPRFAQNVQALAVAYGAWQSRRLGRPR
jgi:hypothetical protein